MAGIALDGHKFNDVANPSGHITCTTADWDSCISLDKDGNCIGGYVYQYNVSVSSTAKGTISGDTTNVYVNSKTIVRQSGRTIETDHYTEPSNIYGSVSGNHTNAQGAVSGGNGKNVYAQGKLIAVNGGAITSHASVSTTIVEGSNNVYIGS